MGDGMTPHPLPAPLGRVVDWLAALPPGDFWIGYWSLSSKTRRALLDALEPVGLERKT